MEIKLIFLCVFVIIFIYGLRIVVKYLEQIRRSRFINNFENYAAFIEFYENKAYDIIYKDKLLVYSLEATKINDKEFEIISKDFCRLVLKLMGPQLQKEYTELYGLDALFLNMMDFFNTKYEEDAIRKESMENIMETDIEEQKWAKLINI